MTDTTTPTPVTPAPANYSTLEKILGVVVSLLLVAFIAGSCQYKKTTDTIDTLTVQKTQVQSKLDQVSKEKDDLEKSVASSSIVLKTLAVLNGKPALDGKGNAIYDYKYIKTVDTHVSDNKGMTVTTDGTTTSTTDTTTKTHEVKVTQQGVPINGVAYISTTTDIFQGKLKGLNVGVSHAVLFDVWVGAEVGAGDISNITGTFETKVLLGAGIP